MTTLPSGPPLLVERIDIHKSCKSIESLLGVLDDYCQVASAMATLEKKLAKAMRETAGLKVTGEVAGNAFNASANIFEALADISSKFAKITDKEYDGIGAGVRKWFKKLAKEEKVHDERISNANARIKQASQAYEKKSKKSARDATEEHARYINLISTLGPEISHDKYNHAVSITQRHIAATYSVAACLSRLAEAEWIRSCEGVRRFCPHVGPLGKWRSLCEGGWDGPMPRELPDIDDSQPDRYLMSSGLEGRLTDSPKTELDENRRMDIVLPASSSVAETYDHQGPSVSGHHPPSAFARQINTAYSSVSSSNGQNPGGRGTDISSLEPPRPLLEPNSGSLRSLSEFPSPPAHFPIPPPRSVTFQQSNISPDILTVSNTNDASTVSPSMVGEIAVQDALQSTDRNAESFERGVSRRPLLRRQDAITTVGAARAQDGIGEFDVNASNTGSLVTAMKHRYSNSSGAISPQPRDIPRLRTSVVDLASRYQPSEPAQSDSQIRRSPLLVRRQTKDIPTVMNEPQYSPQVSQEPSESFGAKGGAASHRVEVKENERQLLERERELERKMRAIEREREVLARARQERSAGPSDAQQPILRPLERRVSIRRQREQQQLGVPPPSSSSQSDRASESGSGSILQSNHSAFSSSQAGPAPSSSSSLQVNQFGQVQPSSRNHLTRSSTASPSQPPSPNVMRSPELNSSSRPLSYPAERNKHAPYCGCDRCSISKYREPSNPTPSPHALLPPAKPIVLRSANTAGSGGVIGMSTGGKGTGVGTTVEGGQANEKSKGGWMRRLTMPVVMSLDHSSKKSHRESSSGSGTGMYALGSGIANVRPSTQQFGLKTGLFSLDGKKNASATNLRMGNAVAGGGGGVREHGRLSRRKSSELSMLVNRNMTKSGLDGRP
ncbi:hypothetical protein AX17_002352 [Amanita inopinata Kibby_2008]|nr:hypothetical protein AX17_002352 [Amanita inopinata Kibby_2008]